MTQTKRKSRQPKVDAKSKELLVQKIQAGTVIDHITAGYALAVMQILGITGREGDIISIAMNVQSKRMKKKDIIKVEGREITTEEINRIALVAPNATINIIRDYKIHEKTRITVPDEIIGIVRCQNPSCITNNERGIMSNFQVVDRSPVRLRCGYCKQITGHDNIIEQLLGQS
ncbi:MAG: aspartate carbamoyltransferase regulatory subunit [Candidatus Odinarchaeota archaeon]